MENKIQSDGGKARAIALSKEERSEIARAAAHARWERVASRKFGPVAKATHHGELNIAGIVISCAVLEDGTRVLTQSGMLQALDMSPTPARGQGTVEDKPAFLAAGNLAPFISEELKQEWKPLTFKAAEGRVSGFKGVAYGYDARILPLVCYVFLDAKEAGKLLRQQEHIATACKILQRGFATVGVVALVDEATGYQDFRHQEALRRILDKYLLKEFAAWAKRFPDDFYKEIFRLRNWSWEQNNHRRPQVIAKYTNNIVYNRLAPNLLSELQTRNPPVISGYRKHKHHQLLTEDVGHPALAQHLFGVIGLMRACDSWDDFMFRLNRAYPVKNSDQLTLDLDLF